MNTNDKQNITEHYCSCGNVFDITDNVKDKFENINVKENTPYFYCSCCSNIQPIESGTKLLIKGGVEQNIYIQKNSKDKTRRKILNNSLLRTKNYICPNKNCESHKTPEIREAIMEHISYNSFIVKYICCVCGIEWLNRV